MISDLSKKLSADNIDNILPVLPEIKFIILCTINVGKLPMEI